MKPDSGLFSKDQTLAALWHARNRQYLCVYSCSDQLDPSACTEKVINLMKRALKPDLLHQAWTSLSLPACWCWHPCNKLPSHPKSHDMILSFFSSSSYFVYSHISLEEPSGIVCSRASFLYCQNVSAGDRLGGHRRFCTFTGLFFLLLKQYEQAESSQRSRL